MAYDDFFGDIDNTFQVASFQCVRTTVAAAAGPTVIHAVGAIQISITIMDVLMLSTAAPAGANTLTVQTNIAAGGYANLTSAIALAAADDVGRTTIINDAQAAVGPADAVQCVHAAADVAGIVNLICYMT